jgi:hypothetical protein
LFILIGSDDKFSELIFSTKKNKFIDNFKIIILNKIKNIIINKLLSYNSSDDFLSFGLTVKQKEIISSNHSSEE